MDLGNELINLNNKFASIQIKLRIEKRGQRLGLRGPLPCRHRKDIKKVQRISLGLPANKEGLLEAEQVVQLIDFQINHGQFDWHHWSSKPSQGKEFEPQSRNTIEAIKKFKLAFFSDPIRNQNKPGARTTWASAYWPYLRRLIEISSKKPVDPSKTFT